MAKKAEAEIPGLIRDILQAYLEANTEHEGNIVVGTCAWSQMPGAYSQQQRDSGNYAAETGRIQKVQRGVIFFVFKFMVTEANYFF